MAETVVTVDSESMFDLMADSSITPQPSAATAQSLLPVDDTGPSGTTAVLQLPPDDKCCLARVATEATPCLASHCDVQEQTNKAAPVGDAKTMATARQVSSMGNPPAEPHSSMLRFSDITCHVTTVGSVDSNSSMWEKIQAEFSGGARHRRQILAGISGQVRSGEVLAIMGASGAGKTTLLDVLARKVASSRITGSLTLDRLPVSTALMRRISAYVRQDDALFASLTVRETLTFSSELRMPASATREEKRRKVDDMIQMLGLSGAADTLIGDDSRR